MSPPQTSLLQVTGQATRQVFRRYLISNTKNAIPTVSFLQILKDKTELVGTAYIELQPGRYSDQCWKDGSIFLDEATFGLFEKVFEQCLPEYNHYAFMVVSRPACAPIVTRLRSMAADLLSVGRPGDLPQEVRFYFNDTQARFNVAFVQNVARLQSVVAELAAWIEDTLQTHGEISILGL